jgi:hypothetical protein
MTPEGSRAAANHQASAASRSGSLTVFLGHAVAVLAVHLDEAGDREALDDELVRDLFTIRETCLKP